MEVIPKIPYARNVTPQTLSNVIVRFIFSFTFFDLLKMMQPSSSFLHSMILVPPLKTSDCHNSSKQPVQICIVEDSNKSELIIWWIVISLIKEGILLKMPQKTNNTIDPHAHLFIVPQIDSYLSGCITKRSLSNQYFICQFVVLTCAGQINNKRLHSLVTKFHRIMKS